MKRAINFISMFCGLLMLGAALIGCGGSKAVEKENALVWPAPPETARVKFVKTIHGEADYQSSLSSLTNSLTGKSAGSSVTRPFDICTDGQGRLWVTDAQTGVLAIDENRKQVLHLGEDSPVPLTGTRGVAFGHHKIFVGTADLGVIVVLDEAGKYLYTIGKQKTFQNPVDVVFDSLRNRLLVVDNKEQKIFVYSESGDSLFTVGQGWGSLDGYLNFPQAVAIDSAGTMYVVDAFNFRVQIFDSTGKFLRKFGEQGNYFGAFARPKGIALDSFGNIYVLDAVDQNFQIFNQDGQLLMFVGHPSHNNDGFQNPVSMCIDQKNIIYVTDQLNSRIQVFQLINGESGRTQ